MDSVVVIPRPSEIQKCYLVEFGAVMDFVGFFPIAERKKPTIDGFR